MKKFLLICFLCVLMFVFGAAGSLHALPIVTVGALGDLPYVGTYDGTNNLGNDNDKWDNVQVVINKWNNFNSPPSLPDAIEPFKEFEVGNPYPINHTKGIITWTGDWTYLTAKYSQLFDVFYIAGMDGSGVGINWGVAPPGGDGGNTTGQKLSHWRLWNPVSVHEPATMLLLGSGLIGLGVLGRKKLFKKS